MNDFEQSPYAGQIRRLMEEGFIDGAVHTLSKKYPHMSSEIEDAVANAVLKIVRRKSGQPIKDLRAYLYGAARNGVMDAYRRAARYDSSDVEMAAGGGRPFEDEVIDLELLRRLQRLVEQWPNRNLKAYALLYLDAIRYDEPLTAEDAAVQLSQLFGEVVNAASISQWKARAIKKLVQEYTDHRLGRIPTESERNDR